LTAAESADSWPRALGAEEAKLGAAGAAEPWLGALGLEGRTPGTEGMADEAAGAGPTAADAGETKADVAAAAEARGKAERSLARGGRAAWGVDDTTAEETDDEVAERASDKMVEGAGSAPGRVAGEETERRAKKLSAASAAGPRPFEKGEGSLEVEVGGTVEPVPSTESKRRASSIAKEKTKRNVKALVHEPWQSPVKGIDQCDFHREKAEKIYCKARNRALLSSSQQAARESSARSPAAPSPPDAQLSDMHSVCHG
jgi:hypothetical protein